MFEAIQALRSRSRAAQTSNFIASLLRLLPLTHCQFPRQQPNANSLFGNLGTNKIFLFHETSSHIKSVRLFPLFYYKLPPKTPRHIKMSRARALELASRKCAAREKIAGLNLTQDAYSSVIAVINALNDWDDNIRSNDIVRVRQHVVSKPRYLVQRKRKKSFPVVQ